VIWLFESICAVGERGQITLPRVIRQIKGITGKDKVIVKLKNNDIVIEKFLAKKQLEKELIEGYKKMAKRDLQVCKDWEVIDKETDAMLDDY